MILTSVEKSAGIQHDIHPLIAERWSPRSFSSKPMTEREIHLLLEAVRWAPSSMNEQPWELMMAAEGTKTYTLLAETLYPGNRTWATKAPLLVLAMARTHFSSGAVNHSALYDLGMAIGNLNLQATHLGISLHQMGGFDKQKLRESLKLSKGLDPHVIIATGYRGSPDLLPEPLKTREQSVRRRKEFHEFTTLDLGEAALT